MVLLGSSTSKKIHRRRKTNISAVHPPSLVFRSLLVVSPQSNLLTSCLCFFFGVVAFRAQGTRLFFLFFSRQAQNCHILNPPLMMEGFLCCCCSSACHCEEKKNPPSSLFFPPVLLFLMSRIPFPVFGRTMECSHGP